MDGILFSEVLESVISGGVNMLVKQCWLQACLLCVLYLNKFIHKLCQLHNNGKEQMS